MIGILKGLIKTIALILFVGVALTMYSAYKTTTEALGGNMSVSNPQLQQQLKESLASPETVIKYGRKAMATAVQIASPVLKEFGINVGTYTEDSDEITRHIENSTSVLNDTTETLTKNQ